jgi:hypothetical protein
MLSRWALDLPPLGTAQFLRRFTVEAKPVRLAFGE